MLKLTGTLIVLLVMVCLFVALPAFAQDVEQTLPAQEQQQTQSVKEEQQILPITEEQANQASPVVDETVVKVEDNTVQQEVTTYSATDNTEVNSEETVVSDDPLQQLNDSFDAQLESAKAQEYDLVADAKSPKKEEKAAIPVNLHLHYWSEVNTQRLDYSMYFAVISYKDIMVRYDYLDFYDNVKTDLNRYWINYGKFPVVKTPDVQITLQPGVHWDSKFNTFYGGYITMVFPKIGLNISQRSYGGEHLDKHYTFADLKLAKTKTMTAYASYYILARGAMSPDAYLGPKVKFGEYFYAWYGFTVCRPGASMLNTSLMFKF
jgi:hypothetical protein